MTYYNWVFLSPFQNIKPQFLYVKNLSKNYANSASKTNTCGISKYYFLSFCFSFTCFLSHFAKRREIVARKKGRKRKQQTIPFACSIKLLLIILCALSLLQIVCANELQVLRFKFPVSWSTQVHTSTLCFYGWLQVPKKG